MVRFRTTLYACVAAVLLLGVSVLTPIAAQETAETPKLDRVLTLSYESAPTAPPSLENGIFRLNASGELSGDLSGTYTQDITQLCACEVPAAVSPINNLFTIETSEGMLIGFVIGYYYLPDPDGDSADYVGHGRVLSVSGSYADLYLADVYLNASVAVVDGAGISDAGTISIVPRS